MNILLDTIVYDVNYVVTYTINNSLFKFMCLIRAQMHILIIMYAYIVYAYID